MGLTETTASTVLPDIAIGASAACADLGRLREEMISLERAGLDFVHWDIMDGQFVANFCLSQEEIASVRKDVALVFKAHLAVCQPERFVEMFAASGAEVFTFQVEAATAPLDLCREVRKAGMRPCPALSPATPLNRLWDLLEEVDQVLLMTVNPGFRGQTCHWHVMDKIRELRTAIIAAGRPLDIEVDGDVYPATIERMAAAGANQFTAGSAIFRASQGYAAAIADLRTRARSAFARAWGGGE